MLHIECNLVGTGDNCYNNQAMLSYAVYFTQLSE